MPSSRSFRKHKTQNTHFARGTCSILIVLKMEERAVFIMTFLKREEILLFRIRSYYLPLSSQDLLNQLAALVLYSVYVYANR